MLVSDKLWCGWELDNLDIKIKQFFLSLYGRGRGRLFSSPAVSSYLSCDQKKKKNGNNHHNNIANKERAGEGGVSGEGRVIAGASKKKKERKRKRKRKRKQGQR